MLDFVDSLLLPGPAKGLAADRTGLVTAQQSGTGLYRIGEDWTLGPPIAVTSPVPGVQGLAVDAFWVYVYDAGRVYRLDRAQGTMTLLTTRARVLGATVLASGQLALIDELEDRVLVFEPDGQVLDRTPQLPGFRPRALAADREGNLYVVNQTSQELVVLNRVGNLVRRVPLPEPCSKIAVDESLNVYLLDATGNRIWRLGRHGGFAAARGSDSGIDFVGTELAVLPGYLVLLDRGRCLLRFRRPWE